MIVEYSYKSTSVRRNKSTTVVMLPGTKHKLLIKNFKKLISWLNNSSSILKQEIK